MHAWCMCCKERQAEGWEEGSRLANACLVVDALGPRGEGWFGGRRALRVVMHV